MVVLAIWIGNSIVDVEGWHNLPKKNEWIKRVTHGITSDSKKIQAVFRFSYSRLMGQIGNDRENSSKEHHSWISSQTSLNLFGANLYKVTSFSKMASIFQDWATSTMATQQEYAGFFNEFFRSRDLRFLEEVPLHPWVKCINQRTCPKSKNLYTKGF